MAQPPAPPAAADSIRYLEPAARPIARATDLGNVQVLKHGNLYLLTDQFGDIHADSRGLGLYEGDTRRLSTAILRVGGERPVLLQATTTANYRGEIQLTNPSMQRRSLEGPAPGDALASQMLGIRRTRLVCGGALEERLRVVNYSEMPETVTVELELGADAADIFEVRGWTRSERGSHLPIAVTPDRATFRYDGLDGCRRSTCVSFSEPAADVSPVDPETAGTATGGWVRFAWSWNLEPGEARELSWVAWGWDRPMPRDAEADEPASRLLPPVPSVDEPAAAAEYDAWVRDFTEVRTDSELFNLVVDRSGADLRLLVNDGPEPGERYVAAGVPWFTTLFGRDALITALQTLAFCPRLAVQTLEVLAARQATEEDSSRDAEPGKILHEWRDGEMARNGEIPHTPYYGTADATPLWLVLFGATWDWTGDRALVDRLWPNALRALEWIDRWGDRDGDGFVEYGRRADEGLINQGWKDSTDPIRDRHGREAKLPIALAEVQAYVFDAKRRMAGLARVRGEDELAGRLDAEADALRVRFDDAFWVADQGYYAMALDGDKRPADGIGSNAGHCLWAGIVPPARGGRVAERLLKPDMFSGWGIRTYASGQPGYNPIGYHTGSVWPHDTSLIAAGLKRYGFHDETNRLIGRVFEAAQHFPDYRLPELFCGFDRDASGVPVPYPVACSPQAWSAASTFMFLQTMLGLRPNALGRELELHRPQLPDWLGSVTIANLRVGDANVDLLFHRWRGGTSAEVLRKQGELDATIRI
jgi:glycogen debranching enzyme